MSFFAIASTVVGDEVGYALVDFSLILKRVLLLIQCFFAKWYEQMNTTLLYIVEEALLPKKFFRN